MFILTTLSHTQKNNCQVKFCWLSFQQSFPLWWVKVVWIIPHTHTHIYLGCCWAPSEPLEHISELCRCRLRSYKPHCNQWRRRHHCRSLTVTELQWQSNLEDKGGHQRAEGERNGGVSLLHMNKCSPPPLLLLLCCAYILTMSVTCGVFVRHTQIREMQEVLPFSCSSIDDRCSSAAGTKIHLVMKMLFI